MTKQANTNQAPAEKLAINNITDLLTHSLALENEAVERYADLAEIMEAHNNHEVSKFFLKMSEIETLHVDSLKDMIRKHNIEVVPEHKYQWITPEGPETTDIADLHYLMTPRQALTLALMNEQRAYDYYTQITNNTTDAETRSLAGELAVEEEEHVALMRAWLDKYPEEDEDEDWDYDDDPPMIQD